MLKEMMPIDEAIAWVLKWRKKHFTKILGVKDKALITLADRANKCVCGESWRLLVSEYEDKISNRYIDTETKKEYTFFGIVWSDDDYYFGMIENGGKLMLLSCVLDIEGHRYELIT